MFILKKSIRHYSLLRINFKSFEYKTLDDIIKSVYKELQILKLNTSEPIVLPLRTRRYTVLRSPHIDKKSREQFETKHYQKFITIYYDNNSENDIENIDFIVHFIKWYCYGCEIKFKFYCK